ncbi:MAG: HlyD family secretion protein [Pseudomonadota bacterium]
MTEEQTNNEINNQESADSETVKKSVNKGALLILIIIVISLVWYLFADRFTPYTTQARVQGYVVGIAPKVAGVITEIWVKNDTRVRQGEPLFEIDQSQYQIALDQASSQLENARSQVGAGDAAVDTARANLQAALANLEKSQKDTDRLIRLRRDDPGTISIRRLEISQASLDQAKANVTAARSQIEQAIQQKGGNDDENNTILKTAETAVDKAQLDLFNTIVRAESNGVITDLRAEVGQYAGTGNPVMTLIALDDVWINAEFTENNLGHVKVGTSAEIILDSIPGQVFEGNIRSIGLGVSNSQSQSSPGALPSISNDKNWLRQSQRFPVVIQFDPSQSEELLNQIRVGGQASIILYSNDHGVLAVLGRLYIRLMSWLSYAY